MSSITATAVPGNGYVRVEVDWSDIAGPPRKAWVYRVLNGVTTTLRDSDPALLSGGRAIIYDTEVPLDTAVTYRSTIALNVNGDMEDGVTEWTDTTNTGTIGTVEQSYDYFVRGEGLASLKLTPTGAATSRAVSEMVPATAGVSYTFSGRLMVPTFYGGGIGIQVHWYNGTTFLSSAGAANDFWPSAGEFGTYGFSATAPATTTNMRIVAAIAGSAPKTMAMYADEMYITRSGVTTINSGSVTLASNGNAWWKDPLHPATMIKLVFDLGAACTTSGVVYGGVSTAPTRAADSTLLDVNSSDLPVSVWGVRKGPQASIRVGTVTVADRDAVYALHASGAPLLLQLPSAYNLADHYQQHGDLTEGYLGPDQRKPWRAFQSGYSQVYAPVGPAEGVFGVRYQDINRWTTYLAAEATGGGAYDTYNRTDVDTWNPTTSGAAYTLSGTAADFDVNGSRGLMSVPTVSTGREARLLGISLQNQRIRLGALGGPTPTGTTNVTQSVRLRWTGVNDYIDVQLVRNVGGVVAVTVRQLVANVQTVTSGAITLTGVALNADVAIQIDAIGTAISVWAWVTGQPRPVTPTAAITATALTTGSPTLRVDVGSGVTGLPYVAQFEDFQVTNLAGATAQNTWWDILQGEGHV
jgi:hypothetical protein